MDRNSSPLQHIEKIEYHIHNHVDLDEVVRWQRNAKESLITITNKLNQIMANEQQFREALARVEAATTAAGVAATAIQARIDALTSAIENAGLPAETEAALLAQIEGLGSNAEALAASLTSMGTVSNPVPDPVPDPVPPVEG